MAWVSTVRNGKCRTLRAIKHFEKEKYQVWGGLARGGGWGGVCFFVAVKLSCNGITTPRGLYGKAKTKARVVVYLVFFLIDGTTPAIKKN